MAAIKRDVSLGDSAPIRVWIEYAAGRFSAGGDRRSPPVSRSDGYHHEPRRGVAVYPDGTVPGAGSGHCPFIGPLSTGNSAYTGGSGGRAAIPGMGWPFALLHGVRGVLQSVYGGYHGRPDSGVSVAQPAVPSFAPVFGGLFAAGIGCRATVERPSAGG